MSTKIRHPDVIAAVREVRGYVDSALSDFEAFMSSKDGDFVYLAEALQEIRSAATVLKGLEIPSDRRVPENQLHFSNEIWDMGQFE